MFNTTINSNSLIKENIYFHKNINENQNIISKVFANTKNTM